MSDPPFNEVQSRFLRKTRMRWLVALLLQLPLPFVVLPLLGTQWLEQQPDSTAKQAMFLAMLIGAAAVVAGLFTRNQTYKANWKGDVIQPSGYCRANSKFFVLLTLGALAVVLISVTARYPAPTIAAAPIFIALMVFNFPNGKPMRPAPPRIAQGEGR